MMRWKATLAISAALFASIVLADDFKTIDGKEYKNAKVSRVEPDGLVLMTKSGISKVYFSELPKEVQERFHYDPEKVAEYTAQSVEGNKRFLQQRAEERQKQADERAKYWGEHPTPAPVISESMHGGALDERPRGPSLVIYASVLNVVDQGLLVIVHGSPIGGAERIPEGATVLLMGKFPGIYDQDKVQAQGTLVGSYEYTSVSGAKKTARALARASVTKLTYFPY
jgi:hypothetical protein